ncbi:hypothetical protein BC834DRAFT_976256 [Gloeopeniophorella convolvens]|nr:hypothetical protein BC834DRAFT_976256 [Gloeopeniophorella convolvens]
MSGPAQNLQNPPPQQGQGTTVVGATQTTQLAQQAAQQPPPPPPAGRQGRLDGDTPTKFDGASKHYKEFTRKFDNWCFLNDGHDAMVNPIRKVALMLNLMEGPIINQRVQDEQEWLRQVKDQTISIADVWKTFRDDADAHFTDHEAARKAKKLLETFEMIRRDSRKGTEGETIEEYIGRFRTTVSNAGEDINRDEVLKWFLKGLPCSLVLSTARTGTPFGPQPWSFDKWRTELLKQNDTHGWMNKIFEDRFQPKYKLQVRPQNQYHRHNAMDVDHLYMEDEEGVKTRQNTTYTRKQLPAAEREKFRSEGRCFECDKQGHIVRNCPQRQGQGGRPTSGQNNGRQRKTEITINLTHADKKEASSSTPTTPPKLGITEAAAVIRQASVEEKEAFCKLMQDDPDFLLA